MFNSEGFYLKETKYFYYSASNLNQAFLKDVIDV